MVDFRKLFKAGVHFGHQTSRWNPKMAPFILGFKNKVHLIDVSKTAHQLEKAARFLETITAEGKVVLWVGTKKPAQQSVKQAAGSLGMPYVNHRWVGGTLSNYAQVKKAVTKLLHYQDVVEKSEQFPYYTKKELNVLKKAAGRLEKTVGGISTLRWPIGAVVLVDVSKEASALKEANKMGVPVIGLVDTNSDPSLVDFVIPANDDAEKSIKIVLDYLVEAAEKGKAVAKVNAGEDVVADDVDPVAATLIGLEEDDAEAAAKIAKKAAGGSVSAAPKKQSAPDKKSYDGAGRTGRPAAKNFVRREQRPEVAPAKGPKASSND